MWKAPTAEQINQSLRAFFRTELPGSEPAIWPNNLYVVSKAIAQALRGYYLRLEAMHRLPFAHLAEGPDLDLHGADIGISRLPEQLASGYVVATAAEGTLIPEGTRLLRGDGAVVTTTKAVTVVGASAIIPVASDDAGESANTDPATPLAPETTLAGVTAMAVDAGGLTGGMDFENDASYRARILDKKRNPPQVGSPAEYVRWARDNIAAITRIFVQRATPAAGSVTVLFMTDNATATGIPSDAMVAQLADLYDLLAPADANVIVQKPTAVPVNVTLTELTPNTLACQSDVRSELIAMFRRRAQPGSAAANFIFSLSWIDEAISMAASEISHKLSAPTTNVTCGANQIATLGTLTFP